MAVAIGSCTAARTRPPSMKTEAITPASEKGSFMPANPAAAPNAIMVMNASGTRKAADGLRVARKAAFLVPRSEEHTSELQSLRHLVCRLLLEKKKKTRHPHPNTRTNHEATRLTDL